MTLAALLKKKNCCWMNCSSSCTTHMNHPSVLGFRVFWNMGEREADESYFRTYKASQINHKAFSLCFFFFPIGPNSLSLMVFCLISSGIQCLSKLQPAVCLIRSWSCISTTLDNIYRKFLLTEIHSATWRYSLSTPHLSLLYTLCPFNPPEDMLEGCLQCGSCWAGGVSLKKKLKRTKTACKVH